jgi:hypothetical protein
MIALPSALVKHFSASSNLGKKKGAREILTLLANGITGRRRACTIDFLLICTL